MSDNPYQSPVESSATPRGSDMQSDPDHLAIVRRGHDSDARTLTLVLVASMLILVTTAATTGFFASEWNPETGEPYAALSLVSGIAALFVGIAAIILGAAKRNRAE